MRHSLWQSFQFAGRGLRVAVRSQRTMRIHVALAAAVALASGWLELPLDEVALLVLCMAAVLAAELTNTAVETVVDLLVGGNHHEMAGRAKDLSAAAVLVTAAGVAIVGLLVLAPPVAAAAGVGHVNLLAVARAATLAAIFALVIVVLQSAGRRGGAGKPIA